MVVTEFKKLHLGCGLNTPAGWVHLDGSWNARLAKYPCLRNLLKALHLITASHAQLPWTRNILIHDVRKELPFKDNSFSAIYAAHLLEHLYLEEAKKLLRECYRVLIPEGVLRMVVPDLKSMVLEYLRQKDSKGLPDIEEEMEPADRLTDRLLFRGPAPPSGAIFYRIYASIKDFHSHKWTYDAESLITYFKVAGFQEVEKKSLHQSRIDGIEAIEEPEKITDGAGICIEGVK